MMETSKPNLPPPLPLEEQDGRPELVIAYLVMILLGFAFGFPLGAWIF
jgi:hypothetical protein